MRLGSKGVAVSAKKMANAGTLRTTLKAVERNSKNMSSKHIISQLHKNIRMRYELYTELPRSKETEAAAPES